MFSCGRGIKIIHNNNYNTVPKNKPCVIQRYIKDPYLIDGRKFDLRLYVLVTSFDPLRVYLFNDGLVRFSSYKYSSSTKDMHCRYIHLTNYSINKKCKTSTQAPRNNEQEEQGNCKWSLSSLWTYLKNVHGAAQVKKCQKEVEDLITKSLIAADAEMTPVIQRLTKMSGVCFELFGVDVLLDKKLKAWLIEFNVAPSLMVSMALSFS